MENTDKNFFIALAYTAATEKDFDILAFSQKVKDNLKELSGQQKPGKVQIGDKSKLGI